MRRLIKSPLLGKRLGERSPLPSGAWRHPVTLELGRWTDVSIALPLEFGSFLAETKRQCDKARTASVGSAVSSSYRGALRSFKKL
jgi:hypothetical protein